MANMQRLLLIHSLLLLLCCFAALADMSLLGDNRPAPDKRLFVSPVIDNVIANISARMVYFRCFIFVIWKRDQALATIFTNCLPNTLDTTTFYTPNDPTIGGKPDTFIITGDIHAMWLRDSTNQVLIVMIRYVILQVLPYIPYAIQDPKLQDMLRGVIGRQTRSVLKDQYANAFNKDGVSM